MSKKDKGRISGRFFPMLFSTIESPAWRELSHGAKCLYLALKKRSPGGNKAYVSTRIAARELKASRPKIREWFAELEHYGFIVLDAPSCLGVDGVGKAPHWRLTELGTTSKASPNGLFEAPPQDFLRWNGTPFDLRPFRTKRGHTGWDAAKIKPRSPRPTHPGNPVLPTPGSASYPPIDESGSDGGSIEQERGGSYGVSITSLTTRGCSEAPTPPSDLGSKTSAANFGPMEDERIVSLSKWGLAAGTSNQLVRKT